MDDNKPRDPSTAQLLRRLNAQKKRRERRRRALLVVVGVLAALLVGTSVASALRLTGGDSSGTTVTTLPDLLATTTVTTADPGTVSSTITSSTESTSTSTSSSTTTTTEAPTTTTTAPRPQFVVVIDPGHQGKGDTSQEPIGPGSSQTKPKVSSGTRGVATVLAESELVLSVSLKLREALEAAGCKVLMTRTTQNVNISNIQRTQLANQAKADLFIRVHADGAANKNAHGIHVLYPAVTKGWTDDIAAPSKRAAQLAQEALIAATGAKDLGIDARSDMTGFNWSDVPVIIPEIGFMTNADEDRRLSDPAYQQKIATALAEAALRFLNGG